jgi:hypothetical protein
LPAHISHGSEATNDNHELTYQYINKRTSGTLTFKAPSSPGNYDFRLHDTDDNGKETAYVAFSVGTSAPPVVIHTPTPGPAPSGSGSMWLDKYSFRAGEDIVVHFMASAGFSDNGWIGILPVSIEHGSEATNDNHELTYQYLSKRTSGTFTFKAPGTPGNYDLRMHDTDDNGREVCNVAFTVK